MKARSARRMDPAQEPVTNLVSSGLPIRSLTWRRWPSRCPTVRVATTEPRGGTPLLPRVDTNGAGSGTLVATGHETETACYAGGLARGRAPIATTVENRSGLFQLMFPGTGPNRRVWRTV